MLRLFAFFAVIACASLMPVLGQDEVAPVRFVPVELVLDSGGFELAAWQVELADPSGRARIAGIEGGEHPAFAEPAHYDPRALRGGRVVLATFSLDDELPTGRTRVATLHVEVRGDAPIDWELELVAAAGPGGDEIDAVVAIANGDEE